MKRKLFRTAQVFGVRVKMFKLQGLLPQGLFGYYSPDDKTVCVDDKLKGADLEATCLHEIFHAALDRVHCQQQLAPEFAEVIVESLTRVTMENYHLRWKGTGLKKRA